MANVSVLEVSFPVERSAALLGAHIDAPKAGMERELEALDLVGWAVGRELSVVAVEAIAVEVRSGAEGQRRSVAAAPVAVSRPDVGLAYPEHPDARTAGFRAQVRARDLEPEFKLSLRAILTDGSRVFIGAIVGRHGAPANDVTGPSEQPGPGTATGKSGYIPTVKGELGELIAETLDGSERRVGNGALGDPLASGSAGVGESSVGALDLLALEGKKVLDLGSGLGEVSRAARGRGASLVDGFDNDRNLISVARLLNAYHKVPRVSFFQRDVADPSSYGERYDIVLALNPAHDVEPALEAISRVADVLVVSVPTHRSDHPLPRSLARHFPCLFEITGGHSSGEQFAAKAILIAASSEDAASEAVGARERLGIVQGR